MPQCFHYFPKCSWQSPYWMIICDTCASTLSNIWSVHTFFSLFQGLARGETWPKSYFYWGSLTTYHQEFVPLKIEIWLRTNFKQKILTDMEKWHIFLLYNFTRHGMNLYQRFWHDLLSYKILGKYNKNSLLILSSNGTWKGAG